MNILKLLKEIEASLTIGSAAEAAIRDVMLKEVRGALQQAPDTASLLKEQIEILSFFNGIIDRGEIKAPSTYCGWLDNVIRRSRQLLFALEPQFAHMINGRWYFSTDLKNPPTTLEGYRQRVREAYESLVGVKFATRGVDYDLVCSGLPIMSEPKAVKMLRIPSKDNSSKEGRHEHEGS